MSIRTEVYHPGVVGHQPQMEKHSGDLKSNGDYAKIVRRRIAEIRKVKKEHEAWLHSRGKKLGVR